MDFEHLYKTYFIDVFYYMRGICKDEAICEEVAQETFFKASKKIESFDGKSDIRAWLFTIAKNTYLSILRKNKRNIGFTEENEIPSAEDFADNLDDRDTALRIHRILHTLKEPYKEVFSLRVFGELNYEDIGKLFSKSAGWARVTYYRAKTMILKELEEHNG